MKVEKLNFAKRWHLDMPLLLGLIILIIFGLGIFYSAADQDLNLWKQQALRLGLGFMLMLGVAQIDPKYFFQLAPWAFGFTLLLLILTLLMGIEVNGAKRWLSLVGIKFQPAELVKLTLPLFLSYSCRDLVSAITNGKTLSCLIWLLLIGTLIAVQPDLGTALVTMMIGFSVLFLAGCDRRWLTFILLAVLIALPLGKYFLHDYQLLRVLNFLDPNRDPLGTGYHIIQAKISIGSGGLSGRGWLSSVQANLDILGERTTDFIFPIAAEEFGWLGSLFLVSLYLGLSCRCLWLARRAQHSSYYLLAGSLALAIFSTAFLNIAMTAGTIPVVGLPLPLISYGGTAMFTTFIGLGMIMAIGIPRTQLFK